jgi:hypothetical protein
MDGLPIISGLKSSYAALKEAGTLNTNFLYICTDTKELFFGGIPVAATPSIGENGGETDWKAYIDAKFAETQPTRADVSGENYFLTITRYPDGWQSGHGYVEKAGNDEGVLITLPDGFAFKSIIDPKKDRYHVGGDSAQAEVGGAVDSLKTIAQTETSFTVQSVHLEAELEQGYTDELFTIFVVGEWK